MMKKQNITILLDEEKDSKEIIKLGIDFFESVDTPIYLYKAEKEPMFYMINKTTRFSAVKTSKATGITFNDSKDRWEITKMYDTENIVEDVYVPIFLAPEVTKIPIRNSFLCKINIPPLKELQKNIVEVLEFDNPGILFSFFEEYLGKGTLTATLSSNTGTLSYIHYKEELLAAFYRRTTGKLGSMNKEDIANITELMLLLIPESIDRDSFINFIVKKTEDYFKKIDDIVLTYTTPVKEVKEVKELIDENSILLTKRINDVLKEKEETIEKLKVFKENENRINNVESKKMELREKILRLDAEVEDINFQIN